MPKNVLYLAVDRTMFPAALFTAYTALEHGRARSFDLLIAVPENSIEPAWLDWAQSKLRIAIKEVNFSSHVGIEKTVNPIYPPSCCYRYLFDLFLPSCDRIIYLDADIRITGDVSLLFDLDLGPKIFAARPGLTVAEDAAPGSWLEFYLTALGWDADVPYASSGVLVINPKRWLHEDFGRQVIRSLQANTDRCLLPDESALNLLVQGDFLPISPVWNMLTSLWLGADLSGLLEPAVMHHSGSVKPWNALDWLTKTGNRSESAHYRRFFRHSPFPHSASLCRPRPTWKQLRRYFTSSVRRGIGQNWSRLNVTKYSNHVKTSYFADETQGITFRGQDGILRIMSQSSGTRQNFDAKSHAPLQGSTRVRSNSSRTCPSRIG